MSFVAPAFHTFLIEPFNLVTQKAVAFRANTTPPGEIYAFLTDRGANYIPQRFLYKCSNNATFSLADEWSPGSPPAGLDADSDIKTQVSFVIDDAGQYLHAVTHVFEVADVKLYYERLDLNTMTWSGEIELMAHGGWPGVSLEIFKSYDIILDRQGLGWQKPVIVTQKLNESTQAYECFVIWWDEVNSLQTRKISGSVTPTGAISITNCFNTNCCFIHAGLNTASYLYFIEFSPYGNPIIPNLNNFEPEPAGDVALPGAQVVGAGGTTLGFLGKSGTTLKFRKYANGALTELEPVEELPTGSDSFGLCLRLGGWHALYGKSTTADLVWKERDNDTGDWLDKGFSVPPGIGRWFYVGSTWDSNNPLPRAENEFGALIYEEESGVARYVHIDDWEPGGVPSGYGGHWPHGMILGSKVFAFDLDTNAPMIVTGNENMRFMDVLRIENDVVFTDQHEFFKFFHSDLGNFKQWKDSSNYDNCDFLIHLRAIDGGNSFWKQANGAIVEWNSVGLDDPDLLKLEIYNDKGDSIVKFLSAADNRKPIRFSLYGKYFIPIISESSQNKFTLRRFEIWGRYYGARI